MGKVEFIRKFLDLVLSVLFILVRCVLGFHSFGIFVAHFGHIFIFAVSNFPFKTLSCANPLKAFQLPIFLASI